MCLSHRLLNQVYKSPSIPVWTQSEERINEILRQKQALFDQLVDDVTLNLSARLSKDELLGLFGLN